MKIAIIGSRNLHVENLGEYIPKETTEIVSGGAKGIDTDAENFAKENGIKTVIFLPDYSRYGRGAPIVRNKQIVDYADEVIAFWDGKSRGTMSVIEYCKKRDKMIMVIEIIEQHTRY